MSLTVDFYVRLFIRVRESAEECHKSLSRYSHVYQCVQCESFYLQKMGFEEQEQLKKTRSEKAKEKAGAAEETKERGFTSKITNAKHCIPEKCRTCGGALRLGGPIWSEPIHQKDFVNRLY